MSCKWNHLEKRRAISQEMGMFTETTASLFKSIIKPEYIMLHYSFLFSITRHGLLERIYLNLKELTNNIVKLLIITMKH